MRSAQLCIKRNVTISSRQQQQQQQKHQLIIFV